MQRLDQSRIQINDIIARLLRLQSIEYITNVVIKGSLDQLPRRVAHYVSLIQKMRSPFQDLLDRQIVILHNSIVQNRKACSVRRV
jgi:hypothetical protein